MESLLVVGFAKHDKRRSKCRPPLREIDFCEAVMLPWCSPLLPGITLLDFAATEAVTSRNRARRAAPALRRSEWLSESVKVRRHVTGILFGDAGVRHGRVRVDVARVADPRHEVRRAVGKHAGDEGPV